MVSGAIHIIWEHDGCIPDLPSDTEVTTRSLRDYAKQQGMEMLELLDPDNDDLGDWANMVAFAIGEYGLRGPMLAATHRGERVLVGVLNWYGYPSEEGVFGRQITVSRFPLAGS